MTSAALKLSKFRDVVVLTFTLEDMKNQVNGEVSRCIQEKLIVRFKIDVVT